MECNLKWVEGPDLTAINITAARTLAIEPLNCVLAIGMMQVEDG
jgi:hypothetical protein